MATWLEATMPSGKRVATRVSGDGALNQFFEPKQGKGCSLLTDQGDVPVQESYDTLVDALIAAGEVFCGSTDAEIDRLIEDQNLEAEATEKSEGEMLLDRLDEEAAMRFRPTPLR